MKPRRLIYFLLAVITAITLAHPSLPGASATQTTITYVEFGSYPQTEVPETPILTDAAYDEYGDAEIDGIRYRRAEDVHGNFRYFRWEPIVWQVAGNRLIAKDVIDTKQYDDQEKQYIGIWAHCEPVTWTDCSLNKWLNEIFLHEAFSEEERSLLTEEIRIPSSTETASIIDNGTAHAYLSKKASDYASVLGVTRRPNKFGSGDARWLHKGSDSSVSSNIVGVTSPEGSCNSHVNVNIPDLGIVPSIAVADLDALVQWSEPMPEAGTMLYGIGGQMALFMPEDVPDACANGWYRTEEEANDATRRNMAERFRASHLSERDNWYINSYYSLPTITIEVDQWNMTPEDVVAYIKPLVDTYYTGNQDDFMCFELEVPYDSTAASSLDEFCNLYTDQINKITCAYWSKEGDVLTVSATGSGSINSGEKYYSRVDVVINASGYYHIYANNYATKIRELAQEAREYSDIEIGQLEYLRYFLGQTTVYDENLWSNTPTTLVDPGIGVCGSYANLVADFCRLLDIPTIYCISKEANHAWNMVYVEDDWYHLDFTGSTSRSYMQNSYSDFWCGDTYYEFDPSGFPEECTAAEISFLSKTTPGIVGYEYGTDIRDNLTTAQLAIAKKQARNPFYDVVPDSFYMDSVLWALENGITSGATETTFNPGGDCLRAQVVTFLWRAAGCPEPATTDNPFVDVKPEDFYYDAVLWAVENGITNGADATHFNPMGVCNRAQVVTFLYRAFESPAVENTASPFTDVPAGQWYAAPVAWAVDNEITNGLSATQFGPDASCNRAQIVTFLYRAYN